MVADRPCAAEAAAGSAALLADECSAATLAGLWGQLPAWCFFGSGHCHDDPEHLPDSLRCGEHYTGPVSLGRPFWIKTGLLPVLLLWPACKPCQWLTLPDFGCFALPSEPDRQAPPELHGTAAAG